MSRLICGFINVDKPAGMTSHDVVAKLRQWTNIKRIGHAGTLDPAATGVLPVAIGPASRLIPYLSAEKIYVAEIRLGIRTTTDDLCGSIIEQQDAPSSISKIQIESVLENFTGRFEQKPPLYSAVHKNGQRLYELARQKLENQSTRYNQSQMAATIDKMLADVKTRPVNIVKIELLQIDLPVVRLRIFCSSGTYIRALARDIGQSIGCGACLQSLCREKSGMFAIQNSLDLERVEHMIKAGQLQQILLTPQMVLNLVVIQVELSVAILIAQGRILTPETITTGFSIREKVRFPLNQYCLVVYSGQSGTDCPKTIALCLITEEKLIKPKVMLTSPQDLMREANK